MGTLNIQDLKPEQAVKRDFSNSDITLKRDGTLIFYKDGKLFSPRCERSERFKHILNILKQNNMPNCFGELYIDNGNVFDVSRSENWNRAKFMPIDLDKDNLNYDQRQILLNQLVKEVSSPYITPLVKFKDFSQGWEFVKESNGEGLVIRNGREWFKVKILKEVKIEIKDHIPSTEKGTFVLIDNNKVSGTSKEFVRQFHDIKAQGKTPIMELEYCFLTDENKYFQPRLRKIYAKGEIGD